MSKETEYLRLLSTGIIHAKYSINKARLRKRETKDPKAVKTLAEGQLTTINRILRWYGHEHTKIDQLEELREKHPYPPLERVLDKIKIDLRHERKYLKTYKEVLEEQIAGKINLRKEDAIYRSFFNMNVIKKHRIMGRVHTVRKAIPVFATLFGAKELQASGVNLFNHAFPHHLSNNDFDAVLSMYPLLIIVFFVSFIKHLKNE